MGRTVGWLLLWLFFAGPVFAETVVLEAELRGQPGFLAPDGDYELPGFFAQHVFVFDLAGVSEPIVAAKLVLPNPPGAFSSPQRRETYAVFGVTDLESHEDAGVGARLGAIEVDRESPVSLEIPLAAPILRVLERTHGEVALGGRIETLRRFDGSERLFSGTKAGAPAPQLVLETDPGTVPAAQATLLVDDDADPDGADGSAGAPFASIAVALDLAAPGDAVEVAPGVYEERVWLKEDVALTGAGPEQTILDATELGSAALTCAAGARVEGFLVKDETPRELLLGVGHLPLVDCGAPTEATGNVFEANPPRAVSLSGSGAWLHHNEIRSLLAIRSEGALVEDNRIEAPGNAIVAAGPSSGDGLGAALLRRNRIRGKLAREVAVDLPCADWAHPIELTLVSNVFLPPPGPPSEGSGGVELIGCLRGNVVGNTFHDTNGVRVTTRAVIASNVFADGTAGIHVDPGADVEIRHNDAFHNNAGFMGAATDYVGFAPAPGDGNLSVDPQFVDAFFEDFRLRPGSPLVDAGDDEADPAGETDLDGDPRVVDGDGDDGEIVDIGAQEHQPDEVLPEPALPIAVDLLPGRSPNELDFEKVSKGTGKVAVAILSDDALDAPEDVDPSTLLLEREPALRCNDRDVDRDGARDLLCSFPLRAITTRGWPFPEPPVCVRGLARSGRKLLGCDGVELTP